MMKLTKTPPFAMGRPAHGLILAIGLACSPVAIAYAAPTKAECVENAQTDYDNAVSACQHWASDLDPYVNCLNDAAFAHQTAYQKCQRIIRRPPALPPVDRAAQRAPSR